MAAHDDPPREDLLLGGGGGGGGGSPSSRPVLRAGGAPAEAYAELVALYDQDADDLRAAVDAACAGLVAASKVPEIADVDVNDEEIGAAGGGSPVTSADEDERELQACVKRKFVEAMEQLQSTHVPKKRRGNLPKEATDAFRRWFDAHYDHPYPSDDEKKQLAIETNTHVAQITNWFINYRKRIWKPAGGGGVADRNSQRLSDLTTVATASRPAQHRHQQQQHQEQSPARATRSSAAATATARR